MTKQKNWLVILAITAFIGVLIATTIKLLTPKQATIPKTDFISQNQNGSSTSFSQISFNGAPPTPVESLPIVSVEASQTTLDYVINSLIEKNQLKPLRDLSRYWLGENYSLYYNEDEDSYFLNNNYDQKKGSIVVSVDKAINTAQNFLNDTFPNLELTPLTSQVSYLAGGRHVNQTEIAKEANFVAIPFTYAVKNIPAYIEKRSGSAFLVTVNANYEVQRLVFQPIFLNINVFDKTKTIQIDEALENINNNQAAIVYAREDGRGIFTIDEIVDGTLTEVAIEYRLDPVAGLGYPFYKFKGELENSEGKIITAEIITPAVVVR